MPTTSNLIGWLLPLAGVAYPVLLLARLYLFQWPPLWMLDTHAVIFFVFILPALSGIVLVVAKRKGAQVTWVTALAFPIWIALVSLLYLYILVEIVVTA